MRTNVEHTAAAAYCHDDNGALSSVKLLTRTTPCTLGLASLYVTDACAHANCVQKHASLARICGSYLWPASLPNEPTVRRELEGFIHMGSGVFCTSVLTSGSISEGDGVSFAPAMALRVRCCAFPPLSVGTGRLFHRSTAPEKNASPRLTGAVQKRRGRACLPSAS